MAAIGDEWEWRNPLPQGSGLRAMTETSSGLVAVGRAGVVVTSPDGVAWTRRDSGSMKVLNAVASDGGSKIVAVGDRGVVLTSTDGGASWAETFSGETFEHWQTAVLGDGLWVVAGFTAELEFGGGAPVLTSPDGVNWTRVATPTAGLNLESSVWTGTRFVLGGFPTLTSADGATWTEAGLAFYAVDLANDGSTVVATGNIEIYSSTDDGLNWTLRAAAASGTGWIGGVEHSGTQFLAWSGIDTGVARTSPDGITWTNQGVPGGGFVEPCAAATAEGDNFVIVANDGKAYRSTDAGVSWSPINTGLIGNLNAVVRTATRWVAVGADGAITGSASPDAELWSAVSSGTNSKLRGIAWHDGLWVAVGRNQTPQSAGWYEIFTSPDGVNWTDRSFESPRTLEENQIYSIAYLGSQWVAAAYGNVLTSSNAITWELTEVGLENREIASSGDRLVMVGGVERTENSSADGIVYLSTDGGSSWSEENLFGAHYLRAVTWTGSQFVTVADNGIVYTSPDGEQNSWTLRYVGLVTPLRGILADGDLLVVVGSGIVATSTDGGATWTSADVPPSTAYYSIEKVDGVYVAVGYDGVVITSTDAVNWTAKTTLTTHELYDTAWDGEQLLVAGEEGTIIATTLGGGTGMSRFAIWQGENFDLPAEAALAAADADPDEDGLVNLVEFAVKSPPKIPGSAPGVVSRNVSGALVLTLDVRDDDPQLSVVGQGGSTPAALAGSLPAAISDLDPDDGVRRLTFTDPVADGTKRFMRAVFSLGAP